jgi:hypothetical protein
MTVESWTLTFLVGVRNFAASNQLSWQDEVNVGVSNKSSSGFLLDGIDSGRVVVVVVVVIFGTRVDCRLVIIVK